MDKLKYSINSIKWDIELEKRLKSDKHLEKYGFKVYSQSDEDGIIGESHIPETHLIPLILQAASGKRESIK